MHNLINDAYKRSSLVDGMDKLRNNQKPVLSDDAHMYKLINLMII